MNRSKCFAALVVMSVATVQSRAFADQPLGSNGSGKDPINDAWVNGSGQNTGAGKDPINDAAEHRTSNKKTSSGSDDPIQDAGNGGSHENKASGDDAPDDVRHFAIEANPLGIIIGHYSAQLEWLLVAHHALVFNPHFDYVSFSNNTLEQHFVGFGAEVGYRYYTSRHDVAGFYAGPSLLLGTYSAGATGDSGSVSFQSIGGAIDIGGQAVVGPGVVIGAGFGLQYTAVNQSFQDLPLTASILAGGGIRPRFLFSIGYAL
jgi:hypothetical protein